MFCDERINTESGKIYKRGILFAMLTALVYSTLRIVRILPYEAISVSSFLTEIFMIVCGVGIYLVGAVRFYGASDERTSAEMHAYYRNAGKLFLFVTLAGYAFSIPFAYDRATVDYPTNYILFLLEILGGYYFYYAFKRREISFNYSIIDKESGDYYRHVFKNIACLAGILALVFGFAICLDFMMHRSILSFLSILLAYIASVFGLGLEYLYISMLEHAAYRDESGNLLGKGTLIAGIVMFFVMLWSNAWEIYSVYVATQMDSGNTPNGTPLGEFLATISYQKKYVAYLLHIVSAIAIGHFLSGVLKSRRTVRAIFWKILASVSGFVYSEIRIFLVNIMRGDFLTTPLGLAIIQGLQIITVLFVLGNIVAMFLLVRGLVLDFGMSRAMYVLPAVSLCNFILELLLSTHSEWLFAAEIVGSVISVGIYLGYFLFFRAFDRKRIA